MTESARIFASPGSWGIFNPKCAPVPDPVCPWPRTLSRTEHVCVPRPFALQIQLSKRASPPVCAFAAAAQQKTSSFLPVSNPPRPPLPGPPAGSHPPRRPGLPVALLPDDLGRVERRPRRAVVAQNDLRLDCDDRNNTQRKTRQQTAPREIVGPTAAHTCTVSCDEQTRQTRAPSSRIRGDFDTKPLRKPTFPLDAGKATSYAPGPGTGCARGEREEAGSRR